ncbi:dihydrofolate reductase [Garciella nitratireducens]|uniref:Dihydrofolate reductase n=1 Tax=Garciella nitratireducens DSM 15102 TaxID=1121911 RepID=A0A1T4KPW0_9FIRM|nr:dihydrofolate reductase [Garciella nitratireducens]RBP40258.1 dihydrofolate reductase [Garciella nitratireducens]SJZ44469.1 dihydrofolate reductase [Garciella nitratireducens DSM 15102]
MINMIVAMDKNQGIGKGNALLAHIKPDLQYFKKITKGHIVIMGYNTYQSLPIKPLPHRQNIVITRKNIKLDNALVLNSLEKTLKWIEKSQQKEIFICGGASIYKQFMPYADRLYITHIFHSFNADVFFPPIEKEWEIKSVQAHRENIEHKYPHIFTIYERNTR